MSFPTFIYKSESLADISPLARDLLERLLAPEPSGSDDAKGSRCDEVDGGGRESGLVQRLGPSSLAALLKLQVPRSGLIHLPPGQNVSRRFGREMWVRSFFLTVRQLDRKRSRVEKVR